MRFGAIWGAFSIAFCVCFAYEGYTVRIPYPGGYVTAGVYAPDVPRYFDGAPIVLDLPGGQSFGTTQPDTGFVNRGVIYATLILPGRAEGPDTTTGTWDARGLASYDAIAAVMAYLGGDITDIAGGRMEDSLSCPVNHDVVGMLGSSNGGNLAVGTLALRGNRFSKCCYLVTYESPTNDQIVFFDLGGKRRDEDHLCDGADLWDFTDDDAKNASVLGYDPVEIPIDYSDLAWDTTWVDTFSISGGGQMVFRGRAFLDHTHDGIITRNALGKLDLNNDCTYDTLEDFYFEALAAAPPETGWRLKLFYTFPVTRELWRRNIIDTLNWPESLATPGEARQFWRMRTAVFWYDSIPRHFPDLKVLLIATQKDHAQVSSDYPNIRQAYDGFSRQGFWVKINPDSLWVREVLPGYGASYPQNPPNWAPAVWESLYYHSVPEVGDFPDRSICIASVLEMCDRCHDSAWGVGEGLSRPKPRMPRLVAKPNPLNESCVIRLWGITREDVLVVFDLRGVVVERFDVGPQTTQVTWSTKNTSSGIYIASLAAGGTGIRLFVVK